MAIKFHEMHLCQTLLQVNTGFNFTGELKGAEAFQIHSIKLFHTVYKCSQEKTSLHSPPSVKASYLDIGMRSLAICCKIL